MKEIKVVLSTGEGQLTMHQLQLMMSALRTQMRILPSAIKVGVEYKDGIVFTIPLGGEE